MSFVKMIARSWPSIIVAIISVAALEISSLFSPLLVALIIGVLVTNTGLSRSKHIRSSVPGAKFLLRLGIVFLGSALTWEALSALGWGGLVVAFATVVSVFVVTCLVGDLLKLEKGLVTLIATAFAICGAAAVAAVESSIQRRDRDVALALAMVTVFGTIMIGVVPLVGSSLGLDPFQVGVWAGASIHEVAQVVAAASLVGSSAALTAATTVKLVRVGLLVLAVTAARWRHRSERADSEVSRAGLKTFVPWFLVGFMVVAVIGIAGGIPENVRLLMGELSTLLLAAGMFGLGLAVRLADLFPLPLRVITLSTLSTVTAAVVPLVLVVAIW
jgi:uncharacterized integral membrane protein (TIGR00698 family)